MKQLNADIKNKDFKKVYLIYGDEKFLVRSYKQKMIDSIVGDNTMNLASFEGKDIDAGAVIDAAETVPFFADKKLILVEDSGWFKTSDDRMSEYIDNIPDSTCMLFVENEVDKRNKMFKKVLAGGYVCELKHPTESELSKWAAAILKKDGKQIMLKDMQLFISHTGLDMQRVRNELEKLIAFTEGRDTVTEEDIKAVTTSTEQSRVFDMVRAITSKRKIQALKLYDDLLALREPPMRILYLIARQFNQMLEVKDLMTSGRTKEEIASVLGIPLGVADGIMRQVRTEDRKILLSYVTRCVETEEAVKTGNMPERLAVEMIICG